MPPKEVRVQSKLPEYKPSLRPLSAQRWWPRAEMPEDPAAQAQRSNALGKQREDAASENWWSSVFAPSAAEEGSSSSDPIGGAEGYRAALRAAQIREGLLRMELRSVEKHWADEHGARLCFFLRAFSCSNTAVPALSPSHARGHRRSDPRVFAASLLDQLARKDETIWQLAQTQAAPQEQRSITGNFDRPAKPPRLGHRPIPSPIPVFPLRDAGAMVQTPPRRKAGKNSYSVYKPAWDDGRPAAPKMHGGTGPPHPPKLSGLNGAALPANGLPKPKGLKGEAMFPPAKKAQANSKQPPKDGGSGKSAASLNGTTTTTTTTNGTTSGTTKKKKSISPKKQTSPHGLRPNGKAAGGGAGGAGGKPQPKASTASAEQFAAA